MSENMKNFSDLYKQIETGIDMQNRTINFGHVDSGSDIDFCEVNSAIRAIDYMVEENHNPITIILDSNGGNVYSMLSLVDKMLEVPVIFNVYGRGIIASAAVLVLAAGDKRYLSKNTTVMVHELSARAGEEKATDRRIDSEEDERLENIMNEILAEHSLMDAKFWKSINKRDLYLTASEAINLGLADAIVPYKKIKCEKCIANLSKKEFNQFIKELYKRIKLESPVHVNRKKRTTYE